MKYHKRVDELICKWSMATGHAFSELHLNSLVDMLGDEMQAENAKLREALKQYCTCYDPLDKCPICPIIVEDW